jgi:transcriptional regulator with XRE-family HTH domain
MVKKHDPAVIEAEENLLIDFQFLLQEALTDKEITLSDLAKKAGLSKGRISQLMSPDANPTVKNMARLFYAIGERLWVSRVRAGSGAEPRQKWNWTVDDDEALTRSDDRLVAVIKETAASNDNYDERFVFIDSELEMAA